MIAHGSEVENPDLGAPEGQFTYDFPHAYPLHIASLRALAWFTNEPGALVNVFWLLGFGAISAAALFALRQLGAAWPAAIAASWIYAFLPYHLLRGEMHLFLSAYYLVPLAALVAIRLLHDAERIGGAGVLPRASRRETAFAAVVALALGTVGFYYAFFGCFLFAVAGAVGALRTRRLAPLVAALALAALTTSTTLAALIPNYRFWSEHGRNAEALLRPAGNAEVFALKIAQLLLPVWRHRIPELSGLQRRYSTEMPLVNENHAATLGVVAASGWLLLVGWVLVGRTRRDAAPSLLDSLAPLNLALTLLGTIGGFGSLVALLFLPEIRAYNRVSIFLAFFGLAALAVVAQPLQRRLAATSRGRWLGAALAAGVAWLGLLDVFPAAMVPDRDEVVRTWEQDRRFVTAIEATLPPRTIVFQLPYAGYPEVVPPLEIAQYEPLRPYLHARTLRFSHGAMKGRPAAKRHAELAAKPVSELPAALRAAGYGALLVDRFGYADRATSLEASLTALLGAAHASADSRWLLFRLRP